MRKITVEIDRVDDFNVEGHQLLNVRANGILVGRLVLEQRGADTCRVVDWKWDGNFALDVDWPVEDHEVGDLLEAISSEIRKQLEADSPGCEFNGFAKIKAP